MSNSIDSNDKLSVIIATSRQAILQESAFVFSCLCFFEDLIIPLDFCNVYHIKMLNQNANRLHNEKKEIHFFCFILWHFDYCDLRLLNNMKGKLRNPFGTHKKGKLLERCNLYLKYPFGISNTWADFSKYTYQRQRF